MKICGEPDKPEVKKHMEDLDTAWDNVTALFAKREENLIHAMEKAMEFHETLQVRIHLLFMLHEINVLESYVNQEPGNFR